MAGKAKSSGNRRRSVLELRSAQATSRLNSQGFTGGMNNDAGPSCRGGRTSRPVPVDVSPVSTESEGYPEGDLRSESDAADDGRVQLETSKDFIGVPPEILRGKYFTVPGQRPKPGLDPTLPPINKIEDIFDDMVVTAERLGFDMFLQHIGSRDLRVATMCSGTESPLLALEMIVDGMCVC